MFLEIVDTSCFFGQFSLLCCVIRDVTAVYTGWGNSLYVVDSGLSIRDGKTSLNKSWLELSDPLRENSFEYIRCFV